MIGNFTPLLRGSLFLCFALSTTLFTQLYAQCAGDDAAITFCDKESQQFIDLFAQLGPNAQTGGVWTDDDNSGGLDENTGQLNTYVINVGGTFNYTYTASGCADNQATVTVTLGSFAGQDNSTAVACSDDDSVNLFQFTGSSPSPTLGEWTSTNGSASLNGEIFNAQNAGEGIYDFTYTVPAQGSCPASSSMVRLEVIRAPESGFASQPIFCETDDLSEFTNYDLRELLVGEDGGGTWSENATTNEISGPTDSVINVENIRDTFGPGIYNFTYTVTPINPACTRAMTSIAVLIEDVVDFSTATFEITTPTEDPATICEDELPYQAQALITVDADEVPDGDYEITYTTSPTPNNGSETLTVSFVQGEAAFAINQDFLNASGLVNIEVVEIIDPNTQLNCQVEIPELIDTLNIVGLPDLSDSVITVEGPICLGEDAIITLSDGGNTPAIELVDDTYIFYYTIDSPSSTFSGTHETEVTSGDAMQTLEGNTLTESGTYTITINQVENSAGCISGVNLVASFEIFPLPDAQSIAVTIADACEGDTVTVTINDTADPANFTDGTYDIEYTISGDIEELSLIINNLDFVNGSATFELDQSILVNGSSTLTLTQITNTVTTCEAINLNTPSDTFTIIQNPDLGATDLSIADICEDESATVQFTDDLTNIPDATYTITYNLSGANTATDQTTNVVFTEGDATFNLGSEILTETGSTTITITSFENADAGCSALNLPLTTSFEIFENPDLLQATLTTEAICEDDSAVVVIDNANLDDGDYEITYALSGANTGTETTITVNFTGSNTSFTIPEAQLNNTGDTQISITGISDLNTPTNCTVSVSNLSAALTVNPNPDLDTITITSSDSVCLGDDGAVFITDSASGLMDGDYTITYSLSGDNTASALSGNITLTDGVASLLIPASQLTNAGSTLVTFELVTNDTTSCSTAATTLSTMLLVVAPPDLSGATITVEDVCLNEVPVTVVVDAPNLATGSYNISYSLSGANVASEIEGTVAVADGIAQFDLEPSNLTNAGEVTLTISSFTNSDSDCTSATNLQTTFTINELPELANENIELQDICLGDNATVTLTNSSFEDGDYTVTYTLTGANNAAETSTVVAFTEGAGNFILDAGDLSTSGETNLNISSVVYEATTCTSNVAVTTNFNVNPIPAINSGQFTAADICLNEDGLVSFSGATGLEDGDYELVYDLSGANSSTGNNAAFTIASGDGSFSIPASLLVNSGITTITINQVTSSTGCAPANIAVSTDFEILPLPDASGLTATAANVCLFEEVTVVLNGAANLPNDNYLVTYMLSGANESEAITETVTFIGGNGELVIAADLLLEGGTTTLTLVDLQNFVTMCSSATLTTPPISFIIEDPDPPSIASDGGVFCINDAPTVADLIEQLTPSTGVTVYDSEMGNTTLSNNTSLVDGVTYYISATNTTTGCESSQRLAVTADLTGCDAVFIPEGFSPNSDGVNDTFEIQNINIIYPNYTIEIFNRNGTVVFKGNAATAAWDGNSNQTRLGGKTLPNGVYFYVIEYNDVQTNPKQGSIYLNR